MLAKPLPLLLIVLTSQQSHSRPADNIAGERGVQETDEWACSARDKSIEMHKTYSWAMRRDLISAEMLLRGRARFTAGLMKSPKHFHPSQAMSAVGMLLRVSTEQTFSPLDSAVVLTWCRCFHTESCAISSGLGQEDYDVGVSGCSVRSE